MEYLKFENNFIRKAKQINIEVNETQIKQFFLYTEELIHWNQKMNLTAIIEPEEILLKHFIDSVCIVNQIKEDSKIIDVGTGAGFPGVPIKIMKNKCKMTLIDAVNKKVEFLRYLCKELAFDQIEILHTRAEDLAKDPYYRESYDVAVSRAVAELKTLLEYLLPFIKVGGTCICMKGPNAINEIGEAKRAMQILGGRIKEVKEIILPESEIKRSIIVIEKIRNTPKSYPRKAGKPRKEPIEN